MKGIHYSTTENVWVGRKYINGKRYFVKKSKRREVVVEAITNFIPRTEIKAEAKRRLLAAVGGVAC